MKTSNFNTGRTKGLEIPFSYFMVVFVICITPTLFNLAGLSKTITFPLLDHNGNHYISKDILSAGLLFNNIWVMLSIATGAFTCALTLIDFRVKKDISSPAVGIILLFVAFLEVYHLCIVNGALSFKIPYIHSIYLSWYLSRVLCAVYLIIGTGLIVILNLKSYIKNQQKTKILLLFSVILFMVTMAGILFVSELKVFPKFMVGNITFFYHPAELLVIALFFAWGAGIMPSLIKSHLSIFTQMLLLSMIPAIFASVHMCSSKYPFDVDYNVAQFLKLFSFLIALTGISLNYSKSLATQHQRNIDLDLEIKERLKIQKNLENNQNLLKHAESIANMGSWELKLKTKEMAWSSSLFKILGYEPNSVKPSLALMLNLITEDYKVAFEQGLNEAESSTELFQLEHLIIQPQGKTKFIKSQAQYIAAEKKIIGTCLDITDLKETSSKLEKSERIYKTIAKNVPDAALLMYDKDFELILFDGSILHQLNFNTLLKKGAKLEELYSDETFINQKHNIDLAFSGQEVQLEEEINHAYYKINYVPVKNSEKEIFSVMVVIQDISGIKAAQKDLELKVDELNRSNQDLEQFAYLASHDLQEPLRKIRAFGDRLQHKFSSEITEDGQDYIRRMQNASERMQILIDDLLTYSRVTRGDEIYEIIDLNELIKKTIDDLEITIEKKNATIHLMVHHQIYAVPAQIRQLFQNLISNAIKFSKEGVAPEVEIKSEIISGKILQAENVSPLKNYCKITIKDNGIGFEEKYKERIFSLFQRLHTRNEYQGTGIGLAVCKKIVEKYHGQISANSSAEIGTTFTILFPQI